MVQKHCEQNVHFSDTCATYAVDCSTSHKAHTSFGLWTPIPHSLDGCDQLRLQARRRPRATALSERNTFRFGKCVQSALDVFAQDVWDLLHVAQQQRASTAVAMLIDCNVSPVTKDFLNWAGRVEAFVGTALENADKHLQWAVD